MVFNIWRAGLADTDDSASHFWDRNIAVCAGARQCSDLTELRQRFDVALSANTEQDSGRDRGIEVIFHF
jgi:hypothetical protein